MTTTDKVAAARAAAERLRHSEHDVNIGAKKDADLALVLDALNLAKTNATVTVTYGDKSATFVLDGTELSDTGSHRYLGNASRDHVASEVERALLSLTDDKDGEPLRPAGEGGWGLY